MTTDKQPATPREGAPEIIYLQDGGDYAAAFPDNPEGVTWNADSPIEDDDTKYIRFDLHERAIAKRTEELVAMTAERDDCVRAFAEDSRRAVKAERLLNEANERTSLAELSAKAGNSLMANARFMDELLNAYLSGKLREIGDGEVVVPEAIDAGAGKG